MFYRWNYNLSRKVSILTCHRDNSTQKNRLTDDQSTNCVKLTVPNRIPTRWSFRKFLIPWRHQLHKDLLQSPWITASRIENRSYFTNSIDQPSISVSDAPFRLRNIAKIVALGLNTSTTNSIRFGNETIKIIFKLGDLSTPTQGQLPDFSRNPTAISEAANTPRRLTTVKSNWGTKGLVHDTLVEELLPFYDAEDLLSPTQPQKQLKCGFSTNSLPLNPLIQLRCSPEKREDMFLLMYPLRRYLIPTMSPTADNSHNPTHG